jgi:hypothetical protein
MLELVGRVGGVCAGEDAAGGDDTEEGYGVVYLKLGLALLGYMYFELRWEKRRGGMGSARADMESV